MAFMDQATKTRLAALCKAALKRWPSVKWTLSVTHHSMIVMTIASGDLDFAAAVASDGPPVAEGVRDALAERGYVQVNHHAIERTFTGDAGAFLAAARNALMTGNHDHSDIQSDHFDVGWYLGIQIGRWNKPYQLTGEALLARSREVGEAMAAESDPVLTRATAAAVETALSEDDGGIL